MKRKQRTKHWNSKENSNLSNEWQYNENLLFSFLFSVWHKRTHLQSPILCTSFLEFHCSIHSEMVRWFVCGLKCIRQRKPTKRVFSIWMHHCGGRHCRLLFADDVIYNKNHRKESQLTIAKESNFQSNNERTRSRFRNGKRVFVFNVNDEKCWRISNWVFSANSWFWTIVWYSWKKRAKKRRFQDDFYRVAQYG